jgi:hypothetical protein
MDPGGLVIFGVVLAALGPGLGVAFAVVTLSARPPGTVG